MFATAFRPLLKFKGQSLGKAAKYIASQRHLTLAPCVGLSVLTVGVLSTTPFAYADAAPPVYAPLKTQKTQLSKKSLISVRRRNSLYQKLKKAAQNAKKILQYARRLLTYALFGIPIATLIPAANVAGRVSSEAEDAVWGMVVWAIEQLGPTFVKFAQWASTRPDLYPPLLIQRLQRLQDDVTTRHTMKDVERTLEHAFGSQWRDHLQLDPSPIGAGCIAQVFKGTLRTSSEKESRKVAVKLIHPHVESLIKIDMELLNLLAAMMDQIPTLEVLNIGDTCRQFGETMTDQLDLTKEARNLQIFAKKFKDESWALFPEPIEGFINKNVLVETLMEGTPISEFMKLADSAGEEVRKLKRQLSDLGCKSILKMVFFDNFVHGDLHPGNILVQVTPEGDPKFVFLDCGIVFHSKTEADHQALVDICLAFMHHDGMKAGKLMLDRNQRVRKEGDEKGSMSAELEKKFCEGIQKMIDDSQHIAFYDHFGVYVAQICDLARDFHVKLDPCYFHVAMALKVVEGVSLSLNNDLDMITRCVPVVVKAMSLRKLGISKFPDNVELQDTGLSNAALLQREGV